MFLPRLGAADQQGSCLLTNCAFVTYSKSHAPFLAGTLVTMTTVCDGGWQCYDVVTMASNL